MWRYNLDDAFHGAVKAYTKHQKLLDFWILSTKMSKKIVENGPQGFIPRELVIFEFSFWVSLLFSCSWRVVWLDKNDLVIVGQLLTLLRVY